MAKPADQRANQEIEQAIADEIYRDCVGARVRTVARAVSTIYEEAMRPLKVRFSQMNILVTAAKLGDTQPAELCKLLQLDHSTVSRSVDRLVERGWLEILPDDDGRASPFRITEKGRALVRKAHPAWKEAQDRALDLLGSAFVSELHTAVGHLQQDG